MSSDFGVKDIKAYLAGANFPEEMIGELAAQYQEACEAANVRLEEVLRLLTAGYRDEALGLADQAPPLTELLAKLDFDGRDDWVVALSALGYEQPTVISMDQISQLEEAYEDRRRLLPLMRKHRLLSLGSAPLSMRLAVLRKLAEVDPINLIWADDVEKFENARLEEIRGETVGATRRGDLEELERLEGELKGQWRISVPRNLLEKVTSSVEQLSRKSASAELKEVASRLHECLAAYDTDLGFALRDKWVKLNETAQLGPGDPTFDLANEALLWLADAEQQKESDRQYQEALEAFEQKISREMELPIIEKFWFHLRRFDREIPKELEQRFLQYRQRVLSAQSRKTRMKIALGVASIAVIGALLAGFIWYNARQRELANARSQASELAVARNVEAAEAWLEKQPDWIRNDAQVAATLADLKAVWREFQSLESKIADELKKVNNLLETSGPLERDVDALVSNASELAAKLAEKKGLEKPDTSEIEGVKAKVEAEREKRLKDRTAEFSSRLSEVSGRLKSLEEAAIDESLSQNLSDVENQLRELGVSKNETKDGRPLIQPNVLSLIPVLQQRVATRRKAMTEYKESLRRMVDITSQIENPEAFSKQLLSFANQYPGSEWSADFRASAADLGLWQSFQAWQELLSNPLWKQLESAKPSDIATLVGKLNELISKQPLDSFVQKASKAKEILEALAISGKVSESQIISNLKERFDNEEFLEQQVLIEKETGAWKYLAGELREKGDNVLYDAFVDSKQDKDDIQRGKAAKKSELDQWGWGGQRAVAMKLLEFLRKPNSPSAQEFGVELLRIVSAEFPQVNSDDVQAGGLPIATPDPLIQLMMLQQVLDETSGLTPLITEINRDIRVAAGEFEVLQDADWMNFKLDETSRKRNAAAQILKDVREVIGGTEKRLEEWKAKLKSVGDWDSLSGYRWTGWVRKVGNQFELATGSTTPGNNSELFQVRPGPGGRGISIKRVGTFSAGAIVVEGDALDLRSGQLLLSIPEREGGQ